MFSMFLSLSVFESWKLDLRSWRNFFLKSARVFLLWALYRAFGPRNMASRLDNLFRGSCVNGFYSVCNIWKYRVFDMFHCFLRTIWHFACMKYVGISDFMIPVFEVPYGVKAHCDNLQVFSCSWFTCRDVVMKIVCYRVCPHCAWRLLSWFRVRFKGKNTLGHVKRLRVVDTGRPLYVNTTVLVPLSPFAFDFFNLFIAGHVSSPVASRFFSETRYQAVLFPTLMSICYQNVRNRWVIFCHEVDIFYMLYQNISQRWTPVLYTRSLLLVLAVGPSYVAERVGGSEACSFVFVEKYFSPPFTWNIIPPSSRRGVNFVRVFEIKSHEITQMQKIVHTRGYRELLISL